RSALLTDATLWVQRRRTTGMTRRLSRYPKHLLVVLSITVLCLTGAASPTQASSLHLKIHAGGNHGQQHLKRQVRVDKLPKASRHKPTIKPHYTIPIVPKGPQIPPMQTVALPHGSAHQPQQKTSAKTHVPNTLSGNTNGDEELEQFQAATFGGNTPPDNGFGVGPNDIMQFVNVTGIDFDRTTAHTQRKTWNLSDFFGAPVNPTQIVNVGYSDPRVIYDAGSGRWFASVLIFDTCSKCATSSNSEVDIAVSQSSDPSGVWNIYPVETTNNNVLLDQPKLGISNDKAVLTYNENGFSGPYRFVEVQKSDLVALAGSVNEYLFSTDSSHYNVIPVLSLGSTNT